MAGAAAAAPPARASRARVIAVTSGKGGVGKSNVSVNLAVKFASCGKEVVLLDADLGLANADVLCNVDLPTNLAHVIARRKN
jgi:flagellar biosynthesis protein FlhG